MTKFLILTSAASSNALSAAGGQSGGTDYTVLFSIIGLLVCIALPTAVILLAILKYEGSFKQILWGILGFVVFSTILNFLVSSIFFFVSAAEMDEKEKRAWQCLELRCWLLPAGMSICGLFTGRLSDYQHQ